MSVDDRFQAEFARLSQMRQQQRQQQQEQTLAPDHLRGGGGGGTSGGMEERVGRLERNVDQLSKDMTDVKVSLATLTERVRHLPSKGFIVGIVTTTMALLGGLILFADRLRALIG